jgi:hypothetical protein
MRPRQEDIGMTERMHAEARQQQELKERERRFLEEQEQRREQREREQKQADLEAYLRQRGERYQDTTGETPSQKLLAEWRDEYAAEREAEHEIETQQRRDNYDPVY